MSNKTNAELLSESSGLVTSRHLTFGECEPNDFVRRAGDNKGPVYMVGEKRSSRDGIKCVSAHSFLDGGISVLADDPVVRFSEAERASWMFNVRDVINLIAAVPAPSTVSHEKYTISYFGDYSILITHREHEPYFMVLDDQVTYYRDSVERLAVCLGFWSQKERESLLFNNHRSDYNEDTKEFLVGGILWDEKGMFIGFDD